MSNQTFEGFRVRFRQVGIISESGVVVGARLRQHVHVHGSAHSINSTTSHWTEFALRLPNGTEVPRSVSGDDIFLRNGHRVSLIWAEYGKKAGWLMLVNHDTRETWTCWPAPHEFAYHLGLVRMVSWKTWFALPLLLALGLSAVDPSAGAAVGWCTAAFAIVAKTINRMRAGSLVKRKVQPAMHRAAELLLRSTDRIQWA